MLCVHHSGKFGHMQSFGKCLQRSALRLARESSYMWYELHQRLLFLRNDVGCNDFRVDLGIDICFNFSINICVRTGLLRRRHRAAGTG